MELLLSETRNYSGIFIHRLLDGFGRTNVYVENSIKNSNLNSDCEYQQVQHSLDTHNRATH